MPTINDGSKHFQAVTYTGNGSTNTITGFSFQPDFVWIKGRSGATDHAIYDAVRGTTLDLASNTTAAETTQSTGLTAFNSTGFTLGALSKVNTNGATYVAWGWNAGGSTIAGTGTNGITNVSYRANPTAGFSVVTYTGSGTAGTVTHGLGVAPSMVITKARSAAGAWWAVYHSGVNGGSSPQNYYLQLQATAAQAAASVYWNNTAPTSSVFSVGTGNDVNQNTTTYVAYCFAPVSGYSAFGSYTGNGSADGPFVYCGFRPRYVLMKRTDTTGDWQINDTGRNGYNQADARLWADISNAETANGAAALDFLSNGFKFRSTASPDSNASGGTYIYAAFAENPFKYSRAR